MLLYLESDLDSAYKIDCKERTKKKSRGYKGKSFEDFMKNL